MVCAAGCCKGVWHRVLDRRREVLKEERFMKKGMETARTTNMTEGPTLPLLLSFAIPLMIGNIFQQIYNLADTVIAGRFLGEEAIAAIGAVSAIYSLLMNATWGLNNGYCIVLSRYFGAGDEKRFKKAVAAMILLNLSISVVLTVFSLSFLKPLMRMLHTPDDIFAQSYLYIAIILAGLVTTVAYNACAGYLRAMGNSKIPLYFLIFSSLLNLTLDVLFIVVMKSGIGGTALATVIAQAVSALLCGGYIFRKYKEYIPEKTDFRPEADLLQEMFSMGFSMALMQAVYSVGSVILQRAINNLGTAVITAHTASTRIREMIMLPMGAFSGAGSTFVGQNYGARKYDRIVEGIRKVIGMELVWSLISICLSWLFGRMIVIWMTGTTDESVIANALLNLKVSAVCFFPLGVLFVLRNSMQAMGHKILPVLSSSIELGVKVLSAAVIVPAVGYPGVVAAEPVTWCLCAVFLSVFYVTIGHQKQRNRVFPA